MKDIEYVIYCRKSSDESSENQRQSIPDQIKKCLEFAEREGLIIKKKPEKFSDFESPSDIEKENNEPDLINRKIYKQYRNLFIIKEEKTGKTPGVRKKWRALIKLIGEGKVNGLISYSPDRQARNMLEGGELIDLVDKNKLKENRLKNKVILDLKYANFHFDDNSAGKMMLGIWFVFSKQYSDKLGEDITRGNESKVESGKAIGRHKPGYVINAQGYHEPHPKYFSLIQEAFEMKLNNVAESKIKDFLDANGYQREYSDREIKKKGEERMIGINTINKMFKDDFYYGKFINGDTYSDLRVTNSYYQPIVTEEQFQIIMDRYRANPITNAKSKVDDEYNDIRSFENDFLVTEDNFHFTFTLPNPKRYKSKLEKYLKEGKYTTLKDIIESHQIQYRCANNRSKSYKLTVTQEDIDKEIIKALKYLKVDEEHISQYVEYCHSQIDIISKNSKEIISSKNLEIGRLKSAKENYIKKHMGIKKDGDEETIYEKEKAEYDRKISILRKEIEGVDVSERDETLELEIFIDMLNNAEKFYKKANYVQKGKIAKILFLNIKITHEKRLLIQPKAGLETLFTHHWWS